MSHIIIFLGSPPSPALREPETRTHPRGIKEKQGDQLPGGVAPPTRTVSGANEGGGSDWFRSHRGGPDHLQNLPVHLPSCNALHHSGADVQTGREEAWSLLDLIGQGRPQLAHLPAPFQANCFFCRLLLPARRWRPASVPRRRESLFGCCWLLPSTASSLTSPAVSS